MKRTWRSTKPSKRSAEVLDDAAAEVASRRRAALVAKHAGDEGMQVARVGGEVVEAVGREARLAEAAQVGNDHLEAGGGEWLDVPPPDPLRLRPAVDEEQGVAAFPGADVGELDALADLRSLDRERAGVVLHRHNAKP